MTGWLRRNLVALQELKVRELDVSYCKLPTSIITSLLTRATTLEVSIFAHFLAAVLMQCLM